MSFLSAYETHGAVTSVTDRVRALGGLMPIDGSLSWIADGVTGAAPLHCYLIETGGGPILLDSGAPVHEALLLDQLDEYLPEAEELVLVLSRIVEFDSFGNAGTIMDRYPVVHVYSQFPVGEWVYYRHVHDEIEREPPPRWTSLEGGLKLSAAGDNNVALEAIDAPLRLLATWWFYEPSTRVLFTSDSFGHAVRTDLSSPGCVTEEGDDTTLDAVREHLLAKFDWVTVADTAPLQEQLRAIFETRPIEAIAPSYGRPLVGASVVQRHYEMMQSTLEELSVTT